jgi:hypothetical protein
VDHGDQTFGIVGDAAAGGMSSDDHDLAAFHLPSEMLRERRITPPKIRKRRAHWVKLPMWWYEPMRGAGGQTYRVAWYMLYLYWRNKGLPFKLPNGMMAEDGVPRRTKWCALLDLEQRGLISVERRLKRSPVITVHVEPRGRN